MSDEYIHFSPTESFYGKKNLLYIELGLLNSIKHLQKYKELRGQELLLKIKFKKTLKTSQDSLKDLDKLLPHTSLKPRAFETSEAEKIGKEIERAPSIAKKKSHAVELEDEISEIKKRISRLIRT